jgi:hypothetical protein
MSDKSLYSLVVTTNPIRDKLVVELVIAEDIVFEFFYENGEKKLAIYAGQEKSPLLTSAETFFKAIQDAMKDLDTFPKP